MVVSLITVSFTDSKVTLAGNQIKQARQGKREAAAPPKLCLQLHTLPVYSMLHATPITLVQ